MRTVRCQVLSLCVSAAAVVPGWGGGAAPGLAAPPSPASSADQRPAATPDGRPVLTVKPKAAAEVRRIITEQQRQGGVPEKIYLRVRVVPGGCQGFQHKLDLDPRVSREDLTFESGGVRVVVFKRQVEMLRGAEVDYVDAPDKRGFAITNPNFRGEAAKKWLPLLAMEKDVK
jgi:iron-sulfur cluster assembly protein